MNYYSISRKILSASMLIAAMFVLVGCFHKKEGNTQDTTQNTGNVATGSMMSGDVQTGAIISGGTVGDEVQGAAMSGLYTGTDASQDPDVKEVLELLEELVK